MTETMTTTQLNAELNNGNRELRQAFARLWGRSRNKYGNKPQVVNGQRFDSIGEMNRFRDLELLQMGKKIEKLERQVWFDLNVYGVLVGRIRIDFTYIEKGAVVAEDFKGKATGDWLFRFKVAKACHQQIDWRISRAGR